MRTDALMGIVDRALDRGKSMGFWRLIFYTVLASELLTTVVNAVNSYIWWGELDYDLMEIGAVDALIVSFIVGMGLVLMLERLRKADKESADKSAYLDNILCTSTDMTIVATDMDFRVTLFNPAAEEMFGYAAPEVIGKDIRELHRGQGMDGERFAAALDLFKRQGELLFSFEKGEKDATRFLDARISGINDRDGRQVGYVMMARDVTERKRSETALQESESKFRTLVEHSLIGVAIIQDGKYVYVNPRHAEMLGYTQEEMTALGSVLDTVHPDDKGLVAENIRRRVSGEVRDIRYQFRFLKKDGGTVHVEVHGSLAEYNGRPSVIGSVLDITERKKAEDEIRELNEDLERRVAERTAEFSESERRFRSILENANLIAIMLDVNADIVFCNDYLLRLTGWTEDELIGRNWLDTFIPAEDHEKISAVFSTIIASGDVIPHYRNPIQTRDGRLRQVSWNNTVMRDNRGGITGVTSIGEDITERIRAQEDREAMQARLNEARKMEAIGNFAGGIAHDFNNLLTVIQGDNDIAKSIVGEKSPAYECLSHVGRAASRASELIKKLLVFSRRKPMARAPMDINGAVADILGILGRLIGERIEVEADLGPDVRTIDADASGIEQVVMNLALNARDAMPEGGRLWIITRNADMDEETCRAIEGARPGRFVRLTVSDSGTGMDDETVKRIFEPFFTTKGRGRGTGLGLSVVYGIVKEHGGWINVASHPGGGSTFEVYLEAA